MEKEFVPYNIALALKELGFDEPCLARQDLKIEDGGYFGIDNPKSDEYLLKQGEYYTLIPLYQQAFRWFREKYNLDSNINPLGINKRFYSIYIVFKNNKEIKGDGNLYASYEEAELACLRKLIELVKEK